MRSHRDRSLPAPKFPARAGFDPDTPIEGFYRMRLRTGGIFVGIHIWHGAPHDPVTGEVMDRSLRWQSHCNGKPIDLERVWPRCADSPIGAKDYAYFSALQGWGEEHAPDSAFADPTRKIDLLSNKTPLPF